MSKQYLTADEFNSFVSRYSLADRMQERCFKKAMAAFSIQDEDEFQRLRDHWLARRDYWRQRKIVLLTKADNYTIAGRAGDETGDMDTTKGGAHPRTAYAKHWTVQPRTSGAVANIRDNNDALLIYGVGTGVATEIVQAVNAHDSLLAALEAIEDELDAAMGEWAGVEPPYLPPSYAAIYESRAIARAAIAQAEPDTTKAVA